MAKFITKYFGEIILDEETDWGDVDVNFNGQEISIAFTDTLTDRKLHGNKLEKCLELLDKYVEINEIAKQNIIEKFPEKDGVINYYFKCHFEDMLDDDELVEVFETKSFKKLDIKKVVEKMEFPDLQFAIQNNGLQIFLDYMVSKEYSDEILCIKMDENLNITGFSQES